MGGGGRSELDPDDPGDPDDDDGTGTGILLILVSRVDGTVSNYFHQPSFTLLFHCHFVFQSSKSPSLSLQLTARDSAKSRRGGLWTFGAD
jgi:hypothetical protein